MRRPFLPIDIKFMLDTRQSTSSAACQGQRGPRNRRRDVGGHRGGHPCNPALIRWSSPAKCPDDPVCQNNRRSNPRPPAFPLHDRMLKETPSTICTSERQPLPVSAKDV